MKRIRPNDTSFETFQDLLTGYRLTSVLQVVFRSGLFEAIEESGERVDKLCEALCWDYEKGSRFLEMLCFLGILERYEETFYPSLFSRKFLLKESPNYQGHSLRFEERLIDSWNTLGDVLKQGERLYGAEEKSEEEYQEALKTYIGSMDEAAKIRSAEMWELIAPKEEGIILDIGGGSGAYLAEFLSRNPGWKAIFCDLPDIINKAREGEFGKKYGNRVTWYSCNLLDEEVNFERDFSTKVDLILFSNIIHCQGFEETAKFLQNTTSVLKEEGMVLVHDFFKDRSWRGSLYDLHMMLNTYNGRTYTIDETTSMLNQCGLVYHQVAELTSHSTLIVTTKEERWLPNPAPIQGIIRESSRLGFIHTCEISPKSVPLNHWAREKCRFGCENYNQKAFCPPRGIEPEKMKHILGEFRKGIVLIGEPPLKEYQKKLTDLERFVLHKGYHKVMSFGSGPCSLCETCAPDQCKQPEKSRPALESCGVDVFALAQNANFPLNILRSNLDPAYYVSLLLVE